MIDQNPYEPPHANDPLVQTKRSNLPPILAGLVMIVVATIVTRGGGLLIAILGVGWWWTYKFWPRKTALKMLGPRHFSSVWSTRQPLWTVL